MNQTITAFLVCLMVLTAGCIVVRDQPTAEPTPESHTATPIYEQSADTPVQPSTASAWGDVNVTELEHLVHDYTNKERTKRGLEPLVYDERLSSIGRYHSWDMARRGYFAHDGPNGSTHLSRRGRYSYSCPNSGENIYKIDYRNNGGKKRHELTHPEILAKNIVSLWMNSTGHRQNILTSEYKAEGIGVFITENGTVYATQEFCG